MSTINLNNCFPLGRAGIREPLPKQRQFLSACLDERPHAPKYIRYVGGIGSGKTLIGCITMLHAALLHRGDYLVARQFMPELKDTTYKTFLELCPPELIKEIRVADMVVKLHTVDGGVSTILFRGLEEPDKLRGLNLNAFYIDEAAQVSEAAFMLLQGRLRGPYWRKGWVTQNPGGHDFLWRWFVHKSHITSDAIKRLFLNIRAPSLENIHLPDGYIDTLMASWSNDRIQREIMGSDDSFEGMVYNEFDRAIHVVKPFAIPKEWIRRVGIDHGYRNPSAWVFGAISPDGEVYIYREYYQKEMIIEDMIRDLRPLLASETIEQARIDPSTRATRGTTGKSDFDAYTEHLPTGFPLLLANNDVSQGIDRVKSYLKPDKRGKPRLYIFETCTNLLDELTQYRWQENALSQTGKANAKEKPVKYHDHALDAARYLIMTCPEATPPQDILPAHLKADSLSIERRLYDELQEFKRPKNNGDPFGI